MNLKTFIKHLLKNKLYTTVTVLGFAISLTFVILLSVYIKNELAVNSLQINKDRIFRLVNEGGSTFPAPTADLVQNVIPEIESYTRTYSINGLISSSGKETMKAQFLLADSTFFNMFTFNLIEGKKETALKTKNSVVLSQKFANKLFGDESPVGKEILLNMETPCIVAGIVEDISKVSNFSECDVIINFRILADLWSFDEILTSDNYCNFGLYFLAKPNTNLSAKSPQVLELFKKNLWLYQNERVKTVAFEPLLENYFSTLEGRDTVQNSKTLVTVLFAIVILILVLAIINYMNLTIAQAGIRAKEIAIKKLLGSSRQKLIILLVSESMLLCLISFIIAVFLSFLAEQVFNNLLKTELNLNNEINNLTFVISFVFVVFIGFISGIIPAVIITRLKAVEVIKGGFRRKSKTIYSNILIGFQYTVVITLIISTIVISKQSTFLIKHNPGFNSQNITLDNVIRPNQKEALRNEFLKIPCITNVSYVQGTPIDGGNNNSFMYNDKPVSFQVLVVDSAFFDMLKIKITPTGVAYSKEGIMLNRTAVIGLGLDSLPKSFDIEGTILPVLGVLDDFNFESLHEKIGMLMIKQMKPEDDQWSILVQINSNDVVSTTNKMKEVYSKFTNGIPFDFEFFDETIQSWYEKEKRTSIIVSYFAILAIIISVMGIFALSLFYNQQRTKEIGIRRVNGASVLEIIKMLNKDFIKWVAIAFIIASPVAYYAMNKWLENFAYKITLSWWIFALAGIIALAVALLTVSWQTYKTAGKNPVKSLRYE